MRSWISLSAQARLAGGLARCGSQRHAERFNAGSGAPAPACGGVIQIDSTSMTTTFVNLKQIPAGSCTLVSDARSGATNIDARILGEVQK
jgi:hypothetical protein